MATVPQIEAAKSLLDPQPYDADVSVMISDSAKTLFKFLRKFLHDNGAWGRYPDLATKLSATVGVDAAHLQAILTNVSNAGSKVATLQGEVNYGTQETIDNELALAISVLYDPIAVVPAGTMPSVVAAAVRAEFCICHARGCARCTEAQRTRGY